MPMEDIDPNTGEVLRAADGRLTTPDKQSNAGKMLVMIEDGAFDADLSEALRRLVCTLKANAFTNGGKSKGGVTIKIDLNLEGEHIFMAAGYEIKLPKEVRAKTIVFALEDGRFAANKPNQHTAFGARDVTPLHERQFKDV